jgi:hypothetical protein
MKLDPAKPLWAQMSPKAQTIFNAYRQAQVAPEPVVVTRPELFRVADIRRKAGKNLDNYWAQAFAELSK